MLSKGSEKLNNLIGPFVPLRVVSFYKLDPHFIIAIQVLRNQIVLIYDLFPSFEWWEFPLAFYSLAESKSEDINSPLDK